MGLALDGWMVEWDPGDPTSVRVGPWPDRTGWTRNWTFKTGAYDQDGSATTPAEQFGAMMTIFALLVVRDGLDPALLHREFRKIDAYRAQVGHRIDGDAEG
ncbi:hypothetical protein [Zavarzinia sp. CC-PAN008]|uniref:hypothetical protein n=1 Tax=Zavarzinia sp. CC-PAN008 TaxID=3243332 RepID=UPI003F7474E9